MTFSWTAHRFAGGALALDVANSVILRADPDAPHGPVRCIPAARRVSRGRPPVLCRAGTVRRRRPAGTRDRAGFLQLREAIDRYFRWRAGRSEPPGSLLADLLEAIASALRRAPDGSLEAAAAQSALRLLTEAESARLKICGHCGWLFLDRSRNRSRAWCDMAVCGNRNKASRHYRRKKESL